MAYDVLITMISKFYTRESLRKSFEEDANNLEKFIKNVKEINSESSELNSLRLNAQVKSLTGASRTDFHEFMKLVDYFEPATMIRDYRVFAQYRSSFNIIYNPDSSKIVKLEINSVNQRKRTQSDWLLVFAFIFSILIYMLFAKPVLYSWLLNDWHLPKIAVGVSLNLITLFLMTVIFRIILDRENYVDLKEKIKKLN